MSQEVEVILIEDNPYDAELTIRAFKKAHPTTRLLHLKDGAEALDYFFSEGQYSDRRPSNAPYVVFLDIKMPKVDGIEVLRRLKSDARTRRIPVTMLTSSYEAADLDECYRLGANSYVVKPVESVQFNNAISEMGNYWLQVNAVAR
jgi:two-component system, response regulator